MNKASFAVSASLVLTLGVGAPAGAAEEAPFAQQAEEAVKAIDPNLRESERDSRTSPAILDPDQQVQEDTVTFRANGRVVLVTRAVGAVAPLSEKAVVAAEKRTEKIKTADAGTREVLVYRTGEGLRGLTIAAWSERDGVNYQITVRGEVGTDELFDLVEKLPADAVRPSEKARRAIEEAPAPVAQAEPAKSGGVTTASVSNLFVDGAGDPEDDLGNEANLCSGCSYSNSNYVWMWQRFLKADAYLQGSHDCMFGPLTATSTTNWKKSLGLPANGTFGSGARTTADNFLVNIGGTTIRYVGLSYSVHFDRATSNYAYSYSGKRLNYNTSTLCN